MGWIQLILDWNKCPAFVATIIIHRVPCNGGNFFISYGRTDFLKMTLLYWVWYLGVRRAVKDKLWTHLATACLHFPVVLGSIFSVPRTIVSRSDHSLISDAGWAKGKKWKGIAPSSGCLKHVLQHSAPTIIKLARELLATATHVRF
jgi:hypothetical protein